MASDSPSCSLPFSRRIAAWGKESAATRIQPSFTAAATTRAAGRSPHSTTTSRKTACGMEISPTKCRSRSSRPIPPRWISVEESMTVAGIAHLGSQFVCRVRPRNPPRGKQLFPFPTGQAQPRADLRRRQRTTCIESQRKLLPHLQLGSIGGAGSASTISRGISIVIDTPRKKCLGTVDASAQNTAVFCSRPTEACQDRGGHLAFAIHCLNLLALQ